jgi:hypothetical protein
MTSATTVDVLIQKGRFEPQEALAVAEAIDMAMTESPIVTIPILDARLAAFDQRFAALDHKIEVARLGLEKKIEVAAEKTNTGIEQIRTEIQRTRSELIRWVFVTLIGSVGTSVGAAVVNLIQNHR